MGNKRCRSCLAVEAAFAANLHHAHTRDRATLDASVSKHLMQPNLLYLAEFADGSIKVGTSTESRSEVRLREQGALAARFVARASDGIAVRELEDRVTAEFGVAQSVSIRRKLDGLVQRGTSDVQTSDLDRLTTEVAGLLVTMGDDRLSPLDQRWEHPNAHAAAWLNPHRYPFRIDEGEHSFEVIEACGRVVALRQQGSDGSLSSDVFVVDIGVLFGVVIELGEHGAPEITLQDSLF